MTDKDDNVVDIGEQRKKRGRPKKESADDNSLSSADKYFYMAKKMSLDPKDELLKPHNWPMFKGRFRYLKDPLGRLILLEELENRVVREVSPSHIQQEMLRYSLEDLQPFPEAQIMPQNIKHAFQSWLSLTEPLTEEPTTFAQASDPGLTFNRLPIDLPNWAAWRPECAHLAPKCPPIFAEFLSRCSDKGAPPAFIGSLLDRTADLQQYLVFKGEGNDGKGALMRFLGRLFDRGAVSCQGSPDKDKFWPLRLYGKRLGIFSDVSKGAIFTSAMFKAITGNDAVFIERKFQDGFTAKLGIKFILCTNIEPEVTGINADMRRMLLIEVKGIGKDAEPDYEERLWEERDEIIRYCWWEYLRLCGRDDGTCGQIPATELSSEAGKSGDEQARTIFTRYFDVAKTAYTDPGTVHWALRQEGFRSTNDIGRFKEAWKRLYKIQVRTHTDEELSQLHPDVVERLQAENEKGSSPTKYFGMQARAGVKEAADKVEPVPQGQRYHT